MKKQTVAVLFLMAMLGPVSFVPAAVPTENDVDEIKGLIMAQEDSWNRGDFEGFMATYWKSDKMCFQSGNSRLYGWETLLNRYKTNYAGEKRGVLTFTDLEITILGGEGGYAYAIGRYNLKYEGELVQGLFTLIFKKFDDVGWRIIHDHSSS
jgi:ketosteroid isomerase-like protein